MKLAKYILKTKHFTMFDGWCLAVFVLLLNQENYSWAFGVLLMSVVVSVWAEMSIKD